MLVLVLKPFRDCTAPKAANAPSRNEWVVQSGRARPSTCYMLVGNTGIMSTRSLEPSHSSQQRNSFLNSLWATLQPRRASEIDSRCLAKRTSSSSTVRTSPRLMTSSTALT